MFQSKCIYLSENSDKQIHFELIIEHTYIESINISTIFFIISNSTLYK